MLGDPGRDLPGALAEAVSVADLLGVEPLLNGDATRAALLEPPAGAAVIHVAAHGQLHSDDPLLFRGSGWPTAW